MSTCYLDRILLDRIAKMSRPGEESFVREFEEQINRQIPWALVHWIYLRGRATHYRTMIDLHPNVQEILWASEILHGHKHLLWFGILCRDHVALDHVSLCYEQVRSQGIAYLHYLWEHFKVPIPTETPTPELRAEFHSQLAGTGTPIKNAEEYAHQIRQIRGQEPEGVGLQTAFPNVSTIPTVVYSWDSGAFATSE